MIRRMFWLTLGAVAGVSGYRKVAKLARVFSPARPTVRSGVPSPAERAVPATPWPDSRLARGARAAAGFARDVKDGMRIYRLSGARDAARLGRQIDTPGSAFTRAITDTDTEGFDKVKDGQ